ncbi:MAG: hypothetical protein ACRDSJ_04200 [Rubrobacteraceae bacterium]
MNEIPEDLMRKITAYGATATRERELKDATRHRVVKGQEQATFDVFSTGKVVDGGKESALRDFLRALRVSRNNSTGKTRNTSSALSTKPNCTPRVGTDEAGKGEYFGPLVVAGVRVLGGKEDAELRSLGVRDSKDLGLARSRKLAAEIEASLGPENVRLVCLPPREYEARRNSAGRNVNRLLGEVNAEVISQLEAEVEVAVVDAFGVKAKEYVEAGLCGGLKVEARPRAEDDAAVAAASILARARYLEEMEKLSEKVGFELPRGSTHVVEAARRVYTELGEEGLRDVAKIHFSTTMKAIR